MLSALSFAALFIIVLTSAVQKQQQLTCNSLQVKIDYDSGLAFLSEEEIKERVNYLSGGQITGKVLSQIDIRTLEREVEKNPFVAAAEVFINQQQQVIVTVVQKRPILRVLNNDGVSYYVSENKAHMPLNDKFTPHVPIAIGFVETHSNQQRDSVVQEALFRLVQLVRNDAFLNAVVDQVYVTESGEFDIVPKINGHVVRLGQADERLEEKLNRLKIFYREGFAKVGWDKYKSIDLRYENQVVCERRDTLNKNM